MVPLESLRTMATSERLRSAGSKWLAVGDLMAIDSWHSFSVILSDKNMKAALSARKICCSDTAEFKVTFIYRKFINSYTDKFIILERDIYICLNIYIYIYIYISNSYLNSC